MAAKITLPRQLQGPTPDTCKLCDGSGWIEATTTDLAGLTIPASQACRCLLDRLVRERIHGTVLEALDLPEDGGSLVTKGGDLTRVNCLLKGTWRAVGPDIRAAMERKLWGQLAPTWTFRVVTDEDLRSAFFADQPNYFRSKAPMSVPDLMEQPSLVIIRVGWTGKAKDTADQFRQALSYRQTKPTWIIEDPKEPLASSPVWSEKLGAMLSTWAIADFTGES